MQATSVLHEALGGRPSAPNLTQVQSASLRSVMLVSITDGEKSRHCLSPLYARGNGEAPLFCSCFAGQELGKGSSGLFLPAVRCWLGGQVAKGTRPDVWEGSLP